ncbi:MAG: helix-turn-helix transcriptional regulator [Kiritimatiellia bacterium]|nr:AraC family transcriptional regulator [Lentisphaerota bacterium]
MQKFPRSGPQQKPINSLPDIAAIGDRIFEPYWAIHDHCAQNCEFLMVTEGRLRTRLGRRRFETGPGDVALIPPGKRHRDEFDPQQVLKIFMVSYHWQDAARYFKMLPHCAGMPLSTNARHEVESLVTRMRSLLHSGTQTDRLLCRACLLNLLLTILHDQMQHNTQAGDHTPGARHRHALMLKARHYLDKHYTEEISLEHIARTLQISPFYLSHLFSQENDFSLMEYLTNLRMQKAKLLLQGGRHSIKEAAYAVGYNDGNYFTKVFRRHFGFTPRDLRDASRGSA